MAGYVIYHLTMIQVISLYFQGILCYNPNNILQKTLDPEKQNVYLQII